MQEYMQESLKHEANNTWKKNETHLPLRKMDVCNAYHGCVPAVCSGLDCLPEEGKTALLPLLPFG